jgi:hypothetical protein
MRKTLSSIAVAGVAILAATGTAQAATTPVQSLSGAFTASNSTVVKTPDGVHFGTYADGGANGGSLVWTGANGLKLKDVKDFSYTSNYKQAGETTGAAPYARIFLDSGQDVILDPSYCATQTPAQAVDNTHQMVGDSVRYGDDGCGDPNEGGEAGNQSWADVVAHHGDERIVKVAVTQGWSTGADVSAMLRQITFNGTTYAFDVAPADGQAGAAALNGRNGAPGLNGATGAAGQNGTTTVITREVPAHSPAKVCAGNNLRVLHAPSRKGERFLSARASLNGKALKVSGRKMTADLRNRAEGNYNVRISSRYRTAGGKVRTTHTVRSLSVACS